MFSHFDTLGLRLATADDLRRQMDSVFEGFGWPRPSSSVERSSAFAERDDHYVLHALVPGATPETVSVTVTGREVTVKGSREVVAPEGFEPRSRERRELTFERTYRMPGPVSEDAVTARLVHGVLTVKVAKAKAPSPRTIDIEVN